MPQIQIKPGQSATTPFWKDLQTWASGVFSKVRLMTDAEQAMFAERMGRLREGLVPQGFSQQYEAMKQDPSSVGQPLTSEQIQGSIPFVTAAAPIAFHGTPHTWEAKPINQQISELWNVSRAATGEMAGDLQTRRVWVLNNLMKQNPKLKEKDLYEAVLAQTRAGANVNALGESLSSKLQPEPRTHNFVVFDESIIKDVKKK